MEGKYNWRGLYSQKTPYRDNIQDIYEERIKNVRKWNKFICKVTLDHWLKFMHGEFSNQSQCLCKVAKVRRSDKINQSRRFLKNLKEKRTGSFNAEKEIFYKQIMKDI